MSIFGRSYGAHITGRLFKDGEEIHLHSVRQAIRHGIAYATEDRKKYGLNLLSDVKGSITSSALGKVSQWGVMNAAGENRIAGKYRADMNIKAATVDVVVGTLSGGNQQKVVLSKWVFADPDVLIFDEPTRGIDVGAKYEIYTIINALADAGKAVIVISSELPELLGICDRIYALAAGRITGQVTRADANQESLMHLMTMQKEAVG